MVYTLPFLISLSSTMILRQLDVFFSARSNCYGDGFLITASGRLTTVICVVLRKNVECCGVVSN